MCGGCGDITHERDVRWCISCDQCVCFDVRGACMSWGGVGLDGDFDVFNACMDRHFACCVLRVCGDVTRSADLVWTGDVGCIVHGVRGMRRRITHNTTSATAQRLYQRAASAGGSRGYGSVDQWISGGRCSHGGAGAEARRKQPTRGDSDPHQRAISAPRAFACVLNTRGFPQVFYTAPVSHPVRVHRCP